MREGFEPFVLARSHIVVEPGGSVSPDDMPYRSSRLNVLEDSLVLTKESARFDGPAYLVDSRADYITKFMLRGFVPNTTTPLWKNQMRREQYWEAIISTYRSTKTLVLRDSEGNKHRGKPPTGLQSLVAALASRLMEGIRRDGGNLSIVLDWHFEFPHELILSVGVSDRARVLPAGEFWANLRSTLV